MKTLERTVTVDKPIDRVYAFLSDFTTSEQWDAGTVSTTRVSGDGGVGTTYRNVSRFLGRDTELTYVITDLDRQWAVAAPLAVYGPTQRWIATIEALRDGGWPVRDGRTRWRLGELTLDWESVAPR